MAKTLAEWLDDQVGREDEVGKLAYLCRQDPEYLTKAQSPFINDKPEWPHGGNDLGLAHALSQAEREWEQTVPPRPFKIILVKGHAIFVDLTPRQIRRLAEGTGGLVARDEAMDSMLWCSAYQTRR